MFFPKINIKLPAYKKLRIKYIFYLYKIEIFQVFSLHNFYYCFSPLRYLQFCSILKPNLFNYFFHAYLDHYKMFIY
jgi:hypothetical protein